MLRPQLLALLVVAASVLTTEHALQWGRYGPQGIHLPAVALPDLAARHPQERLLFTDGQDIPLPEGSLQVHSAQRRGNRLVVDVELANSTDYEIEVPLFNFDARTVDGQAVKIAREPDHVFLRPLPPQGKQRGELVLTVPDSAQGVKLYYSYTPAHIPPFPSAVIALDDAAAQAPYPVPAAVTSAQPFAAGAVYDGGDSVAVNGVVAQLASVRVSGGQFVTNIMVYNGTSDGIIVERDAWELATSAGTRRPPTANAADWPFAMLLPGETLRADLQWDVPAGVQPQTLHYHHRPLPEWRMRPAPPLRTFQWRVVP